MNAAAEPKPIILCPLRFECDALMKRPALASRCRIICCGPGAGSIHAWAECARAATAPIILAGLAGALSDQVPRAIACAIAAVIDPKSGQRWTPRLQIPETPNVPRASITSVDEVVADVAAKRALHARVGASLVDLESVAFAQRADALGWQWAIMRGVSDAAGDALPAGIGDWVSRSGRPRLLAIAGSLLRRPTTASRLIELRSRGLQAMQAVGRALELWIQSK